MAGLTGRSWVSFWGWSEEYKFGPKWHLPLPGVLRPPDSAHGLFLQVPGKGGLGSRKQTNTERAEIGGQSQCVRASSTAKLIQSGGVGGVLLASDNSDSTGSQKETGFCLEYTSPQGPRALPPASGPAVPKEDGDN